MTQLALTLDEPLLVGQKFVPLLSEGTVLRMRRNLMTSNFLIAGRSTKDHDYHSWTGKGQTPAWVSELLSKGYPRQQLEASLP